MADTDNDGIDDSIDRDDDNDGILDIHEGSVTNLNSIIEDNPVGPLAETGQVVNISGSVDVFEAGDFGVNVSPTEGDRYIAFHSDIDQGDLEKEVWSLQLDDAIPDGQTGLITFYAHVLNDGVRDWDNPGVINVYGGTEHGERAISIGQSQVLNGSADGWVEVQMEFTPTIDVSHLTFNVVGTTSGEIFVGLDSILVTNLDLDSDGDGIANRLDLDSDGDGISDVAEYGNATAVDADNDGVVDGSVNSDGTIAGVTTQSALDSDGDGVSDFVDLDSDNDGISDFIEAQPTGGYESGEGGLTDSDGDGIADIFDSTAGHGGTFSTPVNTDGIFGEDGTFGEFDTIPDYLDTDSDGDGVSDTAESGLGAPGADNNGDGIGDNISGVSFMDPGGDTDGTNLASSNLLNVDDDTDSPDFRTLCLARGTRIKTDKGEKRIEDLSVGDRVLTLDNGYQDIRWIGRRLLSADELAAKPKLRPVRIRAGALGGGVPDADLVTSPQHRILLSSMIANRMFGVQEVLVPACKLDPVAGIGREPVGNGVEYFHLLFDNHEIIIANGTPTESLFLGKEALKTISSEGRQEIMEIFPEIRQQENPVEMARLLPRPGSKVRTLVLRHVANSKPLSLHAALLHKYADNAYRRVAGPVDPSRPHSEN